MSERSERLFAALSDISEEKIDEASPNVRTNRFPWRRWGAAAAALALVIGVGSRFLPRLGAGDSVGNGGAGGVGADGASTFMSYAGPVLPLTLREADSAITAEREITLDFAPWAERQHTNTIQVTDTYTLTNTSAEGKTVSLLYPFAGSFREVEDLRPVLAADGEQLETTLRAGGYTGTFFGAEGPESPGRWSLAQLDSWEGYRTLLEGGGYRQSALEDYPDLSDTRVTVYEFTDFQGDGSDAATIRASFHLDYTRTMVLSCGFNGGAYRYEEGWMGQDFFIPKPGAYDEHQVRYLIVLGDNVSNMTTQGYRDGGCEPGDERDFSVTVRQYETSLEDILRKTAREMYAWLEDPGLDFEMYFGLMKENLVAYGVLSDYPAERYYGSSLEDLDFCHMDRIFYLETRAAVPAGESVTLTAEMRKEGSYDFYCAHTEHQGIYGYDMVTGLGSNLTCTRQTALLEDRGQIEIVRQNFGFDLENGVKKVALDPDQEHYYLEVKRLNQDQAK